MQLKKDHEHVIRQSAIKLLTNCDVANTQADAENEGKYHCRISSHRLGARHCHGNHGVEPQFEDEDGGSGDFQGGLRSVNRSQKVIAWYKAPNHLQDCDNKSHRQEQPPQDHARDAPTAPCAGVVGLLERVDEEVGFRIVWDRFGLLASGRFGYEEPEEEKAKAYR